MNFYWILEHIVELAQLQLLNEKLQSFETKAIIGDKPIRPCGDTVKEKQDGR